MAAMIIMSALTFFSGTSEADIKSCLNDVCEYDTDVTIGLFGRTRRDLDGRELEVIHVEEKRGRIP